MKDSEGMPLRKYLQTSRPDLTAFFFIAIQLAEILGKLHKQGIIHRNVRPDHIFIHPGTWQVKMITGLNSDGRNRLLDDSPVETMAYMSPEQIGRLDRTVDYRSDFYSLGAVFYEILTGRLPLQAEEHLQWVHAHVAQKPVYPGEINPDIPPVICAIVMKLLAKNAEERYQSASGLLADLEECRRQWRQSGIIGYFTPGRIDSSGRFQLPCRLYGRESETEALTDAFARVCSGQTIILLVHGYAGTGKTALIHKTLGSFASRQGAFITGKFDQMQQNVPNIPLVRALGSLMRQFLADSPENLAEWRRRILCALGRNGAVITGLIPEVSSIIGSQPPVRSLPPREAQNRFRLVFRKFIRVLARKEHPLVLFLDDLQWADPASLELLQYLYEDGDSRYLLLTGAYRDNEVTATHPLLTTLAELARANIPVQYLALTPLKPESVNQFVADTLHCPGTQSQLLAEILHRKTGGNPFFLGQVLRAAYEENLLCFNTRNLCWEWDAPSIQGTPLTDDVINFMLQKLQQLPPETCAVLKLAACIGGSFDLQVLSMACEQSPGQTAAKLKPAIMEGFVLPADNDGNWREMRGLFSKSFCEAELPTRFKFFHDRVQQAAYALIPETEKEATHVRIGRLLVRYTGRSALQGNIMAMMDHLNRGLHLVEDRGEKVKLAVYNLLAGRKAKSSTAYSAALNYFKSGIALLSDRAWDEHYRLMYNLHLERLECEYFCAHFAKAERLFDLLLAKAGTNREKAEIYSIKMALYAGMEKYQETLQLGIKSLRLLGVRLPENPGKMALLKEILLTKWRLRGYRLEELADLPAMTDPAYQIIMRLLAVQGSVAYFLNSPLYMISFLRILNLSVKYGNTDYSPLGYSTYGFVVNNSRGENYKLGHQYTQLAFKLIEKYDNSRLKCVFYFIVGAYKIHWTEHGKAGVEYLQKAVDYGVEAGEMLYVRYAYTMLIEQKYLLGVSLKDLEQECHGYYKIAKRMRLLNYRLLIASLKRLNGDPCTLSNGDCNEADFKSLIKGDNQAVMTYKIYKMQLYFLYGDYRQALVIADQAQQFINAIKGLMLSVEYNFYHSLTITAGYEELPAGQQKNYRKVLKLNQQQLKRWANACPANFLHKYQLVAAEIARLDGENSEAMTLYDLAIQSAREHGFLQNEAIAGELAAKFHLVQGRKKIAQVYLADACRGYETWGAARKVLDLQERYPHLLSGLSMEEGKAKTPALPSDGLHTININNIDESVSTGEPQLHTIREAMRKLSEETDPVKLLQGFLEIAVGHAGADKGSLILEKNEMLYIKAMKNYNAYSTMVITSAPLEQSNSLPRTMVRYVYRTLTPVVLNDTKQGSVFAGDPYLSQSRPKSVICLPLLCQGIPVGVLYLENSLMTGVFTPDQLELLQFLSNQMAYIRKLQTILAEEDTKANREIILPPLNPLLTEREREILNLIARGMSNKEIARELYLTINTIKTHVLKLYEKLGVTRRIQAVAKARKYKLLKNE